MQRNVWVIGIGLLAFVCAAPSLAQEKTNDTKETPKPATEVKPATNIAPSSAPTSQAASAQAEAPLDPEGPKTLRNFERKLSLGVALDDAEQKQLVALTKDRAASTRALAVAILPWLEPSVSQVAILGASTDSDAKVRAQSVESLLSIARRTNDLGRIAIANRAKELLLDQDQGVACLAGGLLMTARPDIAPDILKSTSPEVPMSVYGCWRSLTPLEKRKFKVPPLPEKPLGPVSKKRIPKTPPKLKTQRRSNEVGNALFVTSASVFGFGIGAGLNSAFVQSRDSLIYRRELTFRSRREPSFAAGLGLGLLTGAVTGGAAYAATLYTDPLTVTRASMVPLNTTLGTAFGVGASLALSPKEPLASFVVMGSALTGFSIGTASAYLAKPTGNDLALTAAMGVNGFALGTLGAFAAIPVGLRTIGSTPRSDFALGLGILSGGLFGMIGTGLGPIVEAESGRLFLSSGIALASAASVTTLTFLVTPLEVDTRSRIALGAGAGAMVVSGALAYFLLPDAVTKRFAQQGAEQSQSLVRVNEKGVGFGVPLVFTTLMGPNFVPTLNVMGGRF